MRARRRLRVTIQLALVCLLACTLRLQVCGQTPLLLQPAAIAYDAAGNLYIADAGRQQVLEATLAGTLIVVAGTGTQGFAGDGGAATSAELNRPQGLAVGPDGTIYIADTGNARIRAVISGVISTFAGSGIAGFGGDGGPATAANLRTPTALAVDTTGGLLICDTTDHRVRRVSGGVIATVAGNGIQGFVGDGSAATAAELDAPMGIAAARDSRVFIADSHNQRVRVVSANGTIGTYAGSGPRGDAGDGGAAVAAQLAGLAAWRFCRTEPCWSQTRTDSGCARSVPLA